MTSFIGSFLVQSIGFDGCMLAMIEMFFSNKICYCRGENTTNRSGKNSLVHKKEYLETGAFVAGAVRVGLHCTGAVHLFL